MIGAVRLATVDTIEAAGDTLTKLWNEIAATLANSTLDVLLRLAGAILLLVFGMKLVRSLLAKLDKRLTGKIDEGIRQFLRSLAAIGLRLLLILTAAALLGVPLTAISATVASAGLAIGLALQGSLANFAGGVMIVLFHPFKVGDYIETGGISGTVESISIFYTTLVTFDNRRIVIPNGTVSNAAVVNHFALPTRRADLEFTASYATDADLVLRTLTETAAAHPKVLQDPPPVAIVRRQDASAVVYLVRAWCASGDYWDVCCDLQKNVKAAFDARGIEIPFPQTDVHIKAQ